MATGIGAHPDSPPVRQVHR